MINTFGLTKHFGSTYALSDVSLQVPAGSVLALLGPNGAGKTTAIRIILNVLRATSGRVEVLGRDSRKLGGAELAQIGYVSESRELPGWMTVRSFLNYCRKFYPGWDDAEICKLVRLFELPLHQKLSSLSRGMRMKVELASSLAYRPSLLILDEPFSGLDAFVREQFVQSIVEQTSRCTVLMASHDLSDIESFATHVAYLSEGRLLFAEQMETLTARFREIEVLLDTPPKASERLPKQWLNVEQLAGLVRFTHTQYDLASCDSEIRQYWHDIRDISVRALPLKSIFLALASRQFSKR